MVVKQKICSEFSDVVFGWYKRRPWHPKKWSFFQIQKETVATTSSGAMVSFNSTTIGGSCTHLNSDAMPIYLCPLNPEATLFVYVLLKE
jgi:hypothetical protein